jgi:hypothetical protein
MDHSGQEACRKQLRRPEKIFLAGKLFRRDLKADLAPTKVIFL